MVSHLPLWHMALANQLTPPPGASLEGFGRGGYKSIIEVMGEEREEW